MVKQIQIFIFLYCFEPKRNLTEPLNWNNDTKIVIVGIYGFYINQKINVIFK